jgi:hypothetical protein
VEFREERKKDIELRGAWVSSWINGRSVLELAKDAFFKGGRFGGGPILTTGAFRTDDREEDGRLLPFATFVLGGEPISQIGVNGVDGVGGRDDSERPSVVGWVSEDEREWWLKYDSDGGVEGSSGGTQMPVACNAAARWSISPVADEGTGEFSFKQQVDEKCMGYNSLCGCSASFGRLARARWTSRVRRRTSARKSETWKRSSAFVHDSELRDSSSSCMSMRAAGSEGSSSSMTASALNIESTSDASSEPSSCS